MGIGRMSPVLFAALLVCGCPAEKAEEPAAPEAPAEKVAEMYKCAGCDKHIRFTAELSGEAIEKLRTFVLRGGFLFCEDWTVKGSKYD